MSSRRNSDRDDDTPTARGSAAGEAKQDQGAYETEIKKAQEELNGITELRQKEASGKELGDKDKEKLRNSNDEESRLQNKIAQLRSEASRKGLRLTV
jgi:hypothetical protein